MKIQRHQVNKRIILLFPLLLFFQESRGENFIEAKTCRSIFLLNSEYSGSYFPTSKYWTRDGVNQDAYSATAAQQANLVSRKVIKGEDLNSAYESIRNWRVELTGMHSFFRPYNPDAIFHTDLGGQYSEYRDALLKEYLPEDQSTHELSTSYVTKDGDRLMSSKFIMVAPVKGIFPQGKVQVDHPMESQKFYAEAILLLKEIRDQKDKSDLALTKFAEAMYVYYIGVPLSAGSAGIGKVFFAGFFLGHFGYTMPKLPDGIDLFAIINSEEQRKHVFVDKIVSLLKENRG